METKQDNRRRNASAQPGLLGSTRLPPGVCDSLVSPDAAPLQEIPKAEDAEISLARAENLLGKGLYGAALREIDKIDLAGSALADSYAFIRQEKISRAHLGIADRYFVRGDADNARKFYRRVIAAASADPAVTGIAQTAGQTFDGLLEQREALMQGLQECIRTGSFEQWCGQKKQLHDVTILDVAEIRQRVFPDFRLERIFGERPPVSAPGYIDPLPPETDFIDFPSALPGSVFRSASPAASAASATQNGLIRASVAMPVVANVLAAKARLFALDKRLNVVGQAAGTVPLFRYDYLRDKARQLITHIRHVESRMLPIQFALDDFAEVVDAIRRPLAEQEAELEAIKRRIIDLSETLSTLVEAKKAVDQVVVALHDAADQCDCDWWCWLASIYITVFAGLIGFALLVALMAVNPALALILEIPILLGVSVAAGYFVNQIMSCEVVGTVGRQFEAAQRGLAQSITENQAELHYALAMRDILIARINALDDELSAVYQNNAARVLDAKTLDLIQAQYNNIRQSLLTRAQTVAAQAQDAFNFERDAAFHLIRDAYFDQDRKDYSAAETLLRDLDGLDYIDVTGRVQKSMQLNHAVSLRKHYPVSFIALRLSGGARFTTALDEFDRWFPGTHQQRIKEVRVEVLMDGKPAPVRGYLSNDGVSMVRFQDTGNKRAVDEVNIFAEPDAELARLCYKRLQRRRHVDTISFPDFGSYLHEDRMRKLQDRERNSFENVGLESTWTIEFLPDQPIDLSKITDVLIHFQYEALFDDNLKRIVEKKRYLGRRESGAIPIRQFLAEEGISVDFSDTVSFTAPVQRLEAPAFERRIVNVGFAIKPKQGSHLDGAAELDVSYDGAAAIHLVTNDAGILATATERPTGTGLAALEAMAHGRSIDRKWTLRITALPTGLSVDAIEDVFLLLNYEYVPA